MTCGHLLLIPIVLYYCLLFRALCMSISAFSDVRARTFMTWRWLWPVCHPDLYTSPVTVIRLGLRNPRKKERKKGSSFKKNYSKCIMNVKRNSLTTSIQIVHDKTYEKHKFINKLRNHKPIWYCVCVFCYTSFVCTSAYVNVHFKTTTTKIIKIILIAGMPST